MRRVVAGAAPFRPSVMSETLIGFLLGPIRFLSTKRGNGTTYYEHLSRFCPILWKISDGDFSK